jgi:hypothetical protein
MRHSPLIAPFLLFLSGVVGGQDVSRAKSDCEALMSAVLPFAEQLLKEHGEFFPYGGALKADGQLASVAGYDGRERPPSNEVIRLIKQGFVEGAKSGDYVATALVYDARITLPSTGQKSDAIAVSLNHRDNYSVVVFFPYQLVNGTLQYGQAMAQEGERDVFGLP